MGQVGESADIVANINVFKPDVIFWDLGWEPTQSLEYLSALPEGSPPVVVLLSSESQAADANSAGARGLLLRNANSNAMFAALLAVTQGLWVSDPSLNLRSSHIEGSSTGAVPELTPRELEVLKLLAEGLPNKSIADRLGISEHTVKFHVNSILGKLGAQSRTEAVTRATRLGLILL